MFSLINFLVMKIFVSKLVVFKGKKKKSIYATEKSIA